jgi:AcrR family transcriptional regulator
MGVFERRQREKDLRREQIQNSAKTLFIQKSYYSTTMEEIAQKAELSPATIYNYFKNKEELYISLNLISLQYLLARIRKIYKNNRIPIDKKILKFKDAMYDTFTYDPLVLRNVFHAQIEDALSTLSKDLLEKINSLSKEIFAIMAKVYEEGVSQGVFVEKPPMAVSDAIWGLFTGILIWEESKRKLNPKKDFLRSTLDTAFEIFYRGIKKGKD